MKIYIKIKKKKIILWIKLKVKQKLKLKIKSLIWMENQNKYWLVVKSVIECEKRK